MHIGLQLSHVVVEPLRIPVPDRAGAPAGSRGGRDIDAASRLVGIEPTPPDKHGSAAAPLPVNPVEA